LIFATEDVGGPLNLIIIPCSNLIAAIFFTFIIFFPSSRLVDWFLQKINQNLQRRLSSLLLPGIVLVLILILLIAGFTLVAGIILENPLALQIIGKQDTDSFLVLFKFLFLGGVPFLLGGFMYWFLLQASRKVLISRKKEQVLSEHPEAG
jgi:hypothetical protein